MFRATLVLFSFLSAYSVRSEELLKKGDSELLGHQTSSTHFQTCSNVDIDLETIKPYKIESTDRTCKRDIVNDIPAEERRRKEEQELYKKMQDGKYTQ